MTFLVVRDIVVDISRSFPCIFLPLCLHILFYWACYIQNVFILRQIWSSCCSVYDDGCCSNQFDVPNPTNIFCYCSHILWRFSHLSLNHKPFFSNSTVSIFSTLSCLRTYSVDTSFLHPYNRCYTLSLSSPFSLSYLWLSSKLLSPASVAICWI